MMKYLSLSDLHRQHHKISLVENEIVDLLFQRLIVLEHLHSRDVTYRDLKSNNILVEDRFSLRVQFIDFDLANDQLNLKTFCESKQYVALEIFIEKRYITAMNI
jgi:serine/threonine protein kinase